MVNHAYPLTRAHLQRLLLVWLGLSALLLLSALLVALRAVHHIEQNTELFAAGEAQTKAAIDDIEAQQASLNSRWLTLASKRDVFRREEILDQLAQSRAQMSVVLESAYEKAESLREAIYQAGHGLLRWTVWLFSACVALFLISGAWGLRASASLFRRLEGQTAELVQLQYQFLETQEAVARRFSHELHDELGQSLTAVKANLSALRTAAPGEKRIDDCLSLVDRAIKDVREMSQLLRPTVLDDFGLNAALHSLVESFSQRTGIDVTYSGAEPPTGLREEAESHLYRIAQEALTNIARHSEATQAGVELAILPSQVALRISDNGKGLASAGPKSAPGLGLAGMRTRARACGGSLTIDSAPANGVKIEVTCPTKA